MRGRDRTAASTKDAKELADFLLHVPRASVLKSLRTRQQHTTLFEGSTHRHFVESIGTGRA